MLARRLLALAVLLLVVGAVSAAVAPRNSPAPQPTRVTPAAPAASAPDVATDHRSLSASVRRPPTARSRLGALVDLSVAVASPTALTLDGYGMSQAGDQDTPAHFNLIAYRAGTFALRDPTGAIVARLSVSGRG